MSHDIAHTSVKVADVAKLLLLNHRRVTPTCMSYSSRAEYNPNHNPNPTLKHLTLRRVICRRPVHQLYGSCRRLDVSEAVATKPSNPPPPVLWLGSKFQLDGVDDRQVHIRDVVSSHALLNVYSTSFVYGTCIPLPTRISIMLPSTMTNHASSALSLHQPT